MVYGIIGCLILIIGFLGFKLYQKNDIDNSLLNEYNEQLNNIKKDISFNKEALNQYESKLLDVQIKANTERQKLIDMRNQLDSAQTSLADARDEYQHLVNDRMKEINESIDEQRQKRQEELDEDFDVRKELMEKALNEIQAECEKQEKAYKDAANQVYVDCNDKVSHYMVWMDGFKQKFENIQAALRLYDAEKQAKLYYTIQLPEEFQEDIEYLLTTVADKVQHQDIISKLVWAEYVKPNLEDTFKRIAIKAEPGIYKLTSLSTGKCYIGKSTNVKTRIADHFKSAVGIKSIADQAVHHAILKEGFWNWQIEVITYCDKDQLSELEKYYIDFFDAQTFGYNKTGGG